MTWKKFTIRIAVVLACILTVVMILDQLVLPWITDMSDTVTVPNLVGLSHEQAKQKLTTLGLVAMEPRIQSSDKMKKGTVMSQLPYSNSVVKEGRRVYLTVSGGIETVRMPTVNGQRLRDARIQLLRIGLQLGDIQYASNDSIASDYIISQSIPPGAEVAPGGIVHITVSRGQSGIHIPDCVGLTYSEAAEVLTQSGLIVGTVQKQSSGAFDANTVLSQTPTADEVVAAGSVVNLIIAQ